MNRTGRAGMGLREMCCMSQPVPGCWACPTSPVTSPHGVPPQLLPETNHQRGGASLQSQMPQILQRADASACDIALLRVLPPQGQGYCRQIPVAETPAMCGSIHLLGKGCQFSTSKSLNLWTEIGGPKDLWEKTVLEGQEPLWLPCWFIPKPCIPPSAQMAWEVIFTEA